VKKLAFAFALILTGCATDSGIVDLGGNQYMLARQASTGFESTSKLQAEVMRDAANHCRAQGKTMTVESEGRTTGAPILGNFPHAEVRFKCVASQRPNDAPEKPE
jgi:hypothetical protein